MFQCLCTCILFLFLFCIVLKFSFSYFFQYRGPTFIKISKKIDAITILVNKILKNYILQWELKEKNSSDPVRHCNITENGNARKFKE